MIIVTRCRTSGMKGHRDYKTWLEPLAVNADSIIAYGEQYIALSSGHRYEVAESMSVISSMIREERTNTGPAAM
jgi:hypothetical protein